MLFVTLENEKGLKVRAQLVGKSARVLADALDELKKRAIEIVRIEGVLPQRKASQTRISGLGLGSERCVEDFCIEL